MTAIMREGSSVVARRVETRPSDVPEVLDVLNIGPKPGRLFPVCVRKLALVPCHGHCPAVPKGFADTDFWLPYARGLSPMAPSEILGVLEEAGNVVPIAFGPLCGLNSSNGEMHKIIASISSPSLVRQLVRQSPRMLPISTWLRPRIVCPVRPAPRATWGREDREIELS